jgi:hypothetical protein
VLAEIIELDLVQIRIAPAARLILRATIPALFLA